jgi:hypothetical protein
VSTSFDTDVPRWTRNTTEHPVWDARVKLIGGMIPAGSSVLDVGAGAMTLERYLPEKCKYTPMDVIRTTDRTLYVDFNRGILPTLDGPYDYAVCGGILEYVTNVDLFIHAVATWARTVILSYAERTTFTHAELVNRERMGWCTHMTQHGLKLLFTEHGLVVRDRSSWSGQSIYTLNKGKDATT